MTDATGSHTYKDIARTRILKYEIVSNL